MFKIKYFIILITLIITIQPVFSVEEITEGYSQGFLEWSDFTGENFFKSRFELGEERAQETRLQKQNFYRRFAPSSWGRLQFHRNKSIPPLKIVRLKIINVKDKISKKHAKEQAEKAELVNDENLADDSLNENPNESVTKDSKDTINNAPENEQKSVAVKQNKITDDDDEDNEVLQEELAEEIQVMVKCKKMKYLPETNEMEAVGNVEMRFPTQNILMFSDRMTYNNMSGIVQLYDNVKIVRNGQEMYGDYMKVDLNEEVGHITNPTAQYAYSLDFEAENGYVFGDTIVAENGKITSGADNIIESRSSGFGEALGSFIVPDEDLSFLINDVDNNKYLLKVNEIKITARASHDKVQLKNPKIYSNKTGKKIFALPSMTFYTNKEGDYFECNIPELGSLSGFGMYAGPGVVLEVPFGSTLKLMPTINYKNRFGFGVMGRFTSATNKTEFGYNTAAKLLVLNGIQRLDDNLFFQYGRNTYMDNWFMGKSWLGYGGELVYEKGYEHKDFLYKYADATYRHRIAAGLFHENSQNISGQRFRNYKDYDIARFKYMAEYSQRLYSMFGGTDTTYYDGWKRVDFGIISQGSVALYGTGDTQFVGRIGPRLSTQYKNWRQDIGYFASCYEDGTPMRNYDRFRYGRSNVYLREYVRLHKYLTLGFYTSYMLKDIIRSTERDHVREATFYAAIGPDDFKLNLGYDWVRENAYFGVSVAMNTKGSSVEYKKMTIKNPDKIGKSDGPSNEIEQTEFVAPPKPYRSKAVVQDLEDATTYMQGEPR